MKGFAHVKTSLVHAAIQGHIGVLSKGMMLKQEAVLRKYSSEYSNGSFIRKWLARKLTPEQYCACNNPNAGHFFIGWDEILEGYLSKVKDEYGLSEENYVNRWSRRQGTETRKALEALINSSDRDTIMLDPVGCKFVEEYYDYRHMPDLRSTDPTYVDGSASE